MKPGRPSKEPYARERTDVQFTLRMTPSLRAKIAAAADDNHRSIAMEIIHRLEISLGGK